MWDHQFTATPDERELAECIRRITTRKLTGTFSRDAAIRMLKDSGFSYKQIREIWTITDRQGNGNLSSKELCAVVRLAGWVQQRGRSVSESLLATAGPLPVLKGLSYHGDRVREHDASHNFYKPHDVEASTSEPQSTGGYLFNQSSEWHQQEAQLVYPQITVAHMKTCRSLFEKVGPINGRMDRQTAEEILMRHFAIPFFRLKTILDLVRTSNRLSLNIREFTLAAYFLEGLQSQTIKTLPFGVPKALYDQLRTPILLSSSPMSGAPADDESGYDSLESAEESLVTSAQSSASNLGLKETIPLSPVRKEPQSSYTEYCPSVPTADTKKISKLWKLVAKHCKIEKVRKVFSTNSTDNTQKHIPSSDVSVKGTSYTDLSESSLETPENNSSLSPNYTHRASMARADSPVMGNQSVEYGIHFTSPHYMPTLRKMRKAVWPEQCPSISSVETKQVAKLWKRVAMHCRLENVLKASSTSNGENAGESELPSDVSTTRTTYTELSESSKALQEDSFLCITEESRYCPSPVPGRPATEDPGTSESTRSRSSVIEQEDEGNPGVTAAVKSACSFGNSEPKVVTAANTVNNEVFSMLKDVKDECAFLRTQLQIMQKAIQKQDLNEHAVAKNVQFATEIEKDAGGSASDSIHMACGPSRRIESPEVVKEPAGPRDKLSSRALMPSRSQASDYDKHDWCQPAQEESHRVHGPRRRDGRRSVPSSTYSFTGTPLPEISRINAKPPLRSILKVKLDRLPTQRISVTHHDGRHTTAKGLPTNTAPKHHGHKQDSKSSKVVKETAQAQNTCSISVELPLASGETVPPAKKRRKLPQPPPELPPRGKLSTPRSPQRHERLKSDIPVASLYRFTGALANEGQVEEEPGFDKLYDSAVRRFLASPTDSRRTSVSTASPDMDMDTAPRSYSSAGNPSIFSGHPHSARTMPPAKIDEYDNTVMKDRKEVAPELGSQVNKSPSLRLRTMSDGRYDVPEVPLQSPIATKVDEELEEILAELREEEKVIIGLKETHAGLLRRRAELLTKLEQENEDLRRMTEEEEQICNCGNLTADRVVEPTQYTPQHSQVVKESDEAMSQLRQKEAEVRDLRNKNAELIRWRMGLVTKLEQQNDELRRALADKEEQIYNPVRPTGDLSIKPPEYTLIWNRHQFN